MSQSGLFLLYHNHLPALTSIIAYPGILGNLKPIAEGHHRQLIHTTDKLEMPVHVYGLGEETGILGGVTFTVG